MVTNILYKVPVRRLYIWQSPQHRPDNIICNQIDYVLIKTRFKNGIKGIKLCPGAYVGSDYNPVIGNLDVKLRKLKKYCRTILDKTKHNNKATHSKAKERINEICKNKVKFNT